ncbi:MAG: OpgC domain-containing protein, partial [Porphyromonadaceae bacterium]|nr:OpgC domain-containing protein [Porphyromonadaceae bacterium]
VVLKGAFDPGRFVIAILAMITVCNIIVRMAANKDGKVLRALQLIGKQSLPIYLIHYFFLPALPMIGAFLTTIPDPSRLFLTETILAAINASIVITVTLFTIKIIRTDKYLAFLCFGDRLKKKAFAQRVEEEA